MNPSLQDHPVSSREQWLDARRRLLAREKQLTRLRDQVAAERRELPWVRVDKDYRFQGERGERSLAELFGGNSQLIVYHFMFAPGWSEGCVGCSFLADHIDGANRHLAHHDVSLVAVSRAPLKSSRRSAGAWAGVSTGTPRTAAISTVTSGCPSTRRNWPPAASTTTTSRPPTPARKCRVPACSCAIRRARCSTPIRPMRAASTSCSPPTPSST